MKKEQISHLKYHLPQEIEVVLKEERIEPYLLPNFDSELMAELKTNLTRLFESLKDRNNPVSEFYQKMLSLIQKTPDEVIIRIYKSGRLGDEGNFNDEEYELFKKGMELSRRLLYRLFNLEGEDVELYVVEP